MYLKLFCCLFLTLSQVNNLIEEVKSLESSSHQSETCSSSNCDDNLKSGLNMTLIHGQYLPEEKTSPIDEIIKHKPEEINVSKAKISTERVENVARTEGIHQEQESTGIAIEDEIKSSAGKTSEIRDSKESINLVSSEMGKNVVIERANSIIRKDLIENAKTVVTPENAKETKVFSPVQEGFCFRPSEQVGPEQMFSSHSEKTKVITEPRTTEMAKNIPATEGFLVETEAASEHFSDNKKGISAKKSSLKSKVNKFAKKVANKIGSLVETESIETLEEAKKAGTAKESKTKPIAKQVSTMNPVQEGVSSLSSEAVCNMVTDDIIKPEKTGVVTAKNETEIVRNVPTSEGLVIEEERAGPYTEEASGEELAKLSQVKSDCKESLIQFPSEIGLSEETDLLIPLDESKQDGATSCDAKVKRMTQNAENISKSIGVNLKDETVNLCHDNHFEGKTIDTCQVRSQSQEIVSLVPSKVGLIEETETVKPIPEQNQQTKDKANISLEKKKTEKVKNIPKSAGINLVEETSDIHSERKMDVKTVGISKIKSKTEETAILVPSHVGSSGKTEIVQPLSRQDEQAEKINITPVIGKCDRAEKVPLCGGVQLNEEKADTHPIELAETNTVVSSKVQPNLKEKVKFQSKEVGVTKEVEDLKPLVMQNKTETAKEQTTKNFKMLSEKVSNISGDLQEEGYAEDLSQEFPQNKHVLSSQHTDMASETATLISTSMGSGVQEDSVEAMRDEEAKQISLVPEEEKKQLTDIFTQESSILGVCDKILGTEDLGLADVEEHKADIKKTVMNKNISSNMPAEVGFSALHSSTEDFSKIPRFIETPKVDRVKKEWELAIRSEKIIGSHNDCEIVEDFQTESTKNEFGQTTKERDFESYKKVTNIQGFEPIESSVQEIKLSQEMNRQSANKTRTRSISTERSSKVSLSVGFQPIENKTESMTASTSDSQVAKINNDDHGVGGIVEKISHISGFSSDFDKPEQLVTKPVEESRINPKIMKIKRERASSLGRTVGFQQPAEEVKSNQEQKKLEEQKPNVSKVPVERNLASSNDVSLWVSNLKKGLVKILLNNFFVRSTTNLKSLLN